MYEVRFHGRGGQGAVMAAQALAEAAVKEGYEAQAFPYFGAERRGAPVEAYARINEKKILNKFQIYEPDFVIILDETLMELEPLARGLKHGGKVVVNSPKAPEEIDLGAGVNVPCATVDADAVALEVLKMPIVNSAILGAFAKVQNIVSLEAIKKAISSRFGEKLGARAGRLNAEAAQRAYDLTKLGESKGKREYVNVSSWLPPWNEIRIGTALPTSTVGEVEIGPGSSRQNYTGRWKTSSPRYMKDKCIRCLRCWWSCPDAAIIRLEDNYMEWDLRYCKGCGICAEICPVAAIEMVKGVRDW